MNHYIDAAAAEYQSPQAVEMEYAGMMPVELDGAICQWSFRCGGNSSAMTRISRNSEHSIAAVPYAEQRRREKAKRAESKLSEIEAARRVDVARIA
jgi:hypothetical protein